MFAVGWSYWLELLLNRIGVSNQVGNIPLDWALGAFILQSTAKLDLEHAHWIANIIRIDSPTLLMIIAIFLVLMFTAWSVSKWRKPQLKTIYDLEKGRYIVTRVNREWSLIHREAQPNRWFHRSGRRSCVITKLLSYFMLLRFMLKVTLSRLPCRWNMYTWKLVKISDSHFVIIGNENLKKEKISHMSAII